MTLKLNFKISLISFFFLTCLALPSLAYLVSKFDINGGQSSFQVISNINNEQQVQTLSTITALEMNYCLDQSSMNVSYCMSFFEMITSNISKLNFTRFSVGSRWYPLGMNGQRVIFDNEVWGHFWKATPFVGLSLGLANASVQEYNASFTDFVFRVGSEFPLTSRILLLGQIQLASSLSSGSKSNSKSASYQGESILLGIVLTKFLD